MADHLAVWRSLTACKKPERLMKMQSWSPVFAEEMNGKRQLLRLQLPENTADLRGMRQEEAMRALEDAIDDCPVDSALFVIHGRGSGRIKAAVRERLKRHPLVDNFGDELKSAGGCTVVELK